MPWKGSDTSGHGFGFLGWLTFVPANIVDTQSLDPAEKGRGVDALYACARGVIADLRSTLADERARTDATLAALMADQAALRDRLNRLDAR